MVLVFGMTALLSIRRSASWQCSLSLLPIQWASPWLPRALCTAVPASLAGGEQKHAAGSENVTLLENLSLLGVDVKKARQRQPGVLRKMLTNEDGVARFLQAKGASRKVIAGVFSRYPRAITRSTDQLEQRWALWRRIFPSDSEVVDVLDRSPESFFRSCNNENMQKNIALLASLGFDAEGLRRVLTAAPRTFSNSAALNRQMVELLEDVGAELGLSERSGQSPRQFAVAVISRNMYVLIRSTKRLRKNIDVLRASLRLDDAQLLALLQGPGADILDLSDEYLRKNFGSLRRKMVSLGCRTADVKKLVIAYPMVLYVGAENMSAKLDCLHRGGITMEQVMKKPRVLDCSTQNIAARIEELQRVGYDFQQQGIGILDLSRKRFAAKLEKLNPAPPPPQEESGLTLN